MKSRAVTVPIRDLRKFHRAKQKLLAALAAFATRHRVAAESWKDMLSALVAAGALRHKDSGALWKLLNVSFERMCAWGKERRADKMLRYETGALLLERLS